MSCDLLDYYKVGVIDNLMCWFYEGVSKYVDDVFVFFYVHWRSRLPIFVVVVFCGVVHCFDLWLTPIVWVSIGGFWYYFVDVVVGAIVGMNVGAVFCFGLYMWFRKYLVLEWGIGWCGFGLINIY